ncbi:MAG TPA: copper-binding protein [Burkholderiales bacterium]|nr:copper-binding protein [Burkholderiales bacterium]
MKLALIVLAVVLGSAGIAQAQHGGKKGADMKQEKAAGNAHKATGKVTKVDQTRGSVTIAHGPVPTMSWPSMTMAFKIKDKAMLDKVKAGDQVEFSFVESGKDHTITEIK